RQAAGKQPAPERGGGAPEEGNLQRIWERVGEMLLRRPGTAWLTTVTLLAPFAVVAGLVYNRLNSDLIRELPAGGPSLAGTRLLEEHFPAGITGPVIALLINPQTDFSSPQGESLVGQLTNRLRAQRTDLGLADVRSLTAPLGITEAAARDVSGLNVPE